MEIQLSVSDSVMIVMPSEVGGYPTLKFLGRVQIWNSRGWIFMIFMFVLPSYVSCFVLGMAILETCRKTAWPG